MTELVIKLSRRRITAGLAGPFAYQRQHRAAERRRFSGQVRQFDHCAQQRVDLHWPSAFQVLQHGRLVDTHFAGALNAFVDADGEFHAQRFGNLPAFLHHGARDGTQIGTEDEAVEGRGGQRRQAD